MDFKDKLQRIRKDLRLSQEDLAEKLDISRQAIAKWETGQAYPEIDNLIKLSNLFQITIDRLIKDNGNCEYSILKEVSHRGDDFVNFLCDAKKMTYAGKGIKENAPSRANAIEFKYSNGKYTYLDSYFGGERFIGEEIVWENGMPVWGMNYSGIVLDENFQGDFLKEALLLVSSKHPYRGPCLYRNGDFTYHCKSSGNIEWFQGNEEIYYDNYKVYECVFHVGSIK